MNDLIVGRRGLGKSTLAEFIASKRNTNKIVFDPNNQFRDAQYRLYDIKKVKEVLERDESDEEPYYISYIPINDPEMEFDRFASVIWPYGDYALIIDESHRLQSPSYINENLDRIIRQAPRRERDDPDPIDTLQTFHVPVDINRVSLSQADYMYVFRVTRAQDIEWMRKQFSDEIAEQVQKLRTPDDEDNPGRDILRVPITRPHKYEIIDNPGLWYVNIRRPEKREG
jgi:adenylate kinase family enzyme